MEQGLRASRPPRLGNRDLVRQPRACRAVPCPPNETIAAAEKENRRLSAMRAALFDRHGAAREVLRVEDLERPEPGPGEMRVKVELSGINPTDWKSRSGATPRPMDGFQIPHHDGAGVIDAVGVGVDPGRIGQRVWLWQAAHGRRWGTAAEWTVV